MQEEDPKFEPSNTLAPAQNVRRREVKVCATCKHWRNVEGWGLCWRPGGFSCDIGDQTQYFMTCDGWQSWPAPKTGAR